MRTTPPSPATADDVWAHEPFVRRLARGLLGLDPEIDDVVQDALLAGLRTGPREPRSLRAWLARVTRNRVVDLVRRRGAERRRREVMATAEPVPAPTPVDLAAHGELLEDVRTAFRSLEPLYGEPLRMRYFEDLPAREIALLLAVPLETVRTRLRRGLVLLRERMDGRHEGSRRRWCLLLLPLARGPEGLLLETPRAASTVAAVLALILGTGAVAGTAWWTLRDAAGTGAPGSTTVEVASGESPSFVPVRAGTEAPPPSPRGEGGGTDDSPAAGTAVADSMPPPQPAKGGSTTSTSTVPWVFEVADADGRPVAETRISLQTGPGPDADVRARGVTDARGRVQWTEPPSGDDVDPQVLVLDPPVDREDLDRQVLGPWTSGVTRISLRRFRSITGTVLGEDGGPLADVLVEAEPLDGVRVDAAGNSLVREGRSDAEGRFLVRGLAAGTYLLRLMDPGHGPLEGDRTREFKAGTRNVVLHTSIEGRVAIRVRDWNRASLLRTRESRARSVRKDEGVLEFADWDVAMLVEVDPAEPAAPRRMFRQPVDDAGRLVFFGLRPDRDHSLWVGPLPDGRFVYQRFKESPVDELRVKTDSERVTSCLLQVAPGREEADSVLLRIRFLEFELQGRLNRPADESAARHWSSRLNLPGLPKADLHRDVELQRDGKTVDTLAIDTSAGKAVSLKFR